MAEGLPRWVLVHDGGNDCLFRVEHEREGEVEGRYWSPRTRRFSPMTLAPHWIPKSRIVRDVSEDEVRVKADRYADRFMKYEEG